MSPKAKFKINVSDANIRKIAECLTKKEVTNAIFVTSQREVRRLLHLTSSPDAFT